jgi:hypothetical protein
MFPVPPFLSLRLKNCLLIFFAVFFHSLFLSLYRSKAVTMLLKYADKVKHKIIVCLFILRSVYGI